MSEFPVEVKRHSCAHIMAAAIQELWPDAKFGVGPAIENGFYYDVLFPEPIKFEDLTVIEKTMRKLRKKSSRFQPSNVATDEAIRIMGEMGQEFKTELIALLRDKGTTAVAEETGDTHVAGDEKGAEEVTFYKVGNFTDLCRGPHVDTSKQIGHFKLHRLAGAYWRGDEKRPQLQRIYGLCFDTEEELNAEVDRLEQVKLRDHRRIGKDLDIYHMSQEVGSGLPLWLPNGMVIRDELEYLARIEEKRDGYERVATPHITNEKLYYQSGHLPYYKDDMYAPIEIDGDNFYLRPMNCPHHHHVYLSRPKSYRDLPMRIAEYGQVYRYEASGALSGMMRTRGFCQNDAHIYCSFDQAKQEFIEVMNLHDRYYKMFDIQDYYMRLSLPDLDNLDKYVDEPDKWLAALEIIRAAMQESGLPYQEAKGEAAFYGPKVDFIIKSVVGVEYAISTNQLDFLATDRFGLTYSGPDGQPHPVYVIHRAPLGSHERFVAFLIEHYNGNLPVWLAPVQLMIVPISDAQLDYAEGVRKRLLSLDVRNGTAGLRVKVDSSSDRMQKKIRTATVNKVPLIAVVGDKEVENGTVTLRTRSGEDLGAFSLGELDAMLTKASESRSDDVLLKQKV